MSLAKKVARLDSADKKYYLGAVIAKGNRVISVGVNSYGKTHTKCKDYFSQAIHAEMSAILVSNENVQGTSIYIYRESRAGKKGCSKPCPECMYNLLKYHIKTVYFLDSVGNISKRELR